MNEMLGFTESLYGDSYLEHYGIKGMKWGVRRTPEQLGHAPKGIRKSKQKTADELRKEDMRRAVENRRQLSEKELKERVERLKLEKQLRELTDAEINSGRDYAEEILKDVAKRDAKTILSGGLLYVLKAAMTGTWSWKEAADYMAPRPKKK